MLHVSVYLLGIALLLGSVTVRANREQETAQSCDDGYEQCSGTGRCILATWICDGEDDCLDNWDEPDACATRVCPAGQLRCNSGQCLEMDLFCIGLAACADGSVMPRDTCPATSCPYGHMLCPGSAKCIREAWLCDGDNDCDDGWDESAAACLDRPCSEQHIKCNSGRCVDKERFCAGLGDCGDNTKVVDVCPDLTCEPGWTKCRTVNKCIRDEWLCDADPDCADGSDEDEAFCGVDSVEHLLELIRRSNAN